MLLYWCLLATDLVVIAGFGWWLIDLLLDGWLFANVSGLDLLACGFVVLQLCFSVGGLLVFNSVDYYVMSFRFNELLSLWVRAFDL